MEGRPAAASLALHVHVSHLTVLQWTGLFRLQKGRSRPEKGAAAPAASAPGVPARVPPAASLPWTPPQLTLPDITWHGMPETSAGDAAPATDASAPTPPATRGAPGSGGGFKPEAVASSSLSGLLGSAQAWAQFRVDRSTVMDVLVRGLAPLQAARR